MKLYSSNPERRGLTILEVLVVVIVILVLLVAVALPVLAAAKRRSSRINCVSNLKQVDLSFRIWEGDNNNQYPMTVSVTNGGAMELITTGNVAGLFRVISNELSTPKILVCPEDMRHVAATDFGANFSNSNLSYFVSLDAKECYPQEIMVGDDNLVIGGVPVKPDVVSFAPNDIAWGPNRHDAGTRIPFLDIPLNHKNFGNIGYADGSVAELSINGLQQAAILATNGTDVLTNRFAIP